MRIRSLLPAAALAFAAAATAAPPLEVPFPRQSPEKERRMVEEAGRSHEPVQRNRLSERPASEPAEYPERRA